MVSEGENLASCDWNRLGDTGLDTTHECSWIVVMPQANGMSQLVRHHIACNIGQHEGGGSRSG